MSIIIDGTTYNLPIKTLKRKADMLYKSAERTEDGVLHSELIGVYFNYSLEVGMSSNNVAEYAALYLKITEPIESHSVTLLASDGSFDAYFANINDQVMRFTESGVNYFRDLTFDVIAISPARTP